MEQVLSLLPFLACPLGMGLMMWMMMRGSGQQSQSADVARGSKPAVPSADGLTLTADEQRAVLEARQRRLDAEMRALETEELQPSRN